MNGPEARVRLKGESLTFLKRGGGGYMTEAIRLRIKTGNKAH
jgi:hypothetical protein